MTENLEQTQKQLISYVISNSALHEVIKEGIKPEHFGKYKDFAETLYKLHSDGVVVSFDAISAKYKGKAFKAVLELASTEIGYDFYKNISFFCSNLKEALTKKKFETLLSSSLQNIESIEVSSEITKYTNLEKEASSLTSIKSVADLQESILKSLDDPNEQGLQTNMKCFDLPSGGCKVGKLVTIAARPGMGKTAFVLCLLEGLLEQGIPTGFISLEMTIKEIVERLICMRGFDNNNIRKGNHIEDPFVRSEYIRNLEAVCTAPFYVDEDSGIGINDIKQKLYSLSSKGCKVVAIDYLQLISLAGRKTTTEEIGEITRMLKSLAKKLGMTIFLLSQLSREVEKRSDKIPSLADLRSSGDIEQDSDMVIFLFRPAYYIDKGSLSEEFVINELQLQPEQTAVIFDKNRGGQTRTEICYFEGKHYKFTEE